MVRARACARAREAAGLSLDQVAQQLKLAPRQVKALEDENFGELPGRTFSRGFVRNYARLLNLDPEDLLLALARRCARACARLAGAALDRRDDGGAAEHRGGEAATSPAG